MTFVADSGFGLFWNDMSFFVLHVFLDGRERMGGMMDEVKIYWHCVKGVSLMHSCTELCA